jgi:hypothetical protein
MAVKRARTVMTSEQLDAELRDLVAEAALYGKRAEAAAITAGEPMGEGGREAPDPGELAANIRAALSEEIVIAREVGGETEIAPAEQDREIAKRGLLHIKLQTLRRIAKDLGVPDGGNLENVTDAIARELGDDREKIAKLIVTYEEEPPSERNFTTRIFQLRDGSSDLPALERRLSYITGRYVRTGIARWFIVGGVQASASLLRLDGTFRTFRADATERGEDLTLTSDEQNASARLLLRSGDPFAEVEAKGEAESRAAIAAFEGSTPLRRLGLLTPPREPLRGELATWHNQSVLLIDLLQSRFRSGHIEILDLNIAGFKTERTSRRKKTGEEEESAVRIKAVRFEGRHLLDSRPACELLSSGQHLVQLGMTVRFTADTGDEHLLPLTVKLASDHVVVLTGFGVVSPQIARELHRTATDGIRKALRSGLADPASLDRLATAVRERAGSEEEPRLPTLFVSADVDEDAEAQDPDEAPRAESS